MSKHVVGRDLGEVQIGEHTWTVRPYTRAAAKASSDIAVPDMEKARSFEDIDSDALVTINYIDKRLKGDTSAGEVLKAMWEADEIGLDDLTSLSVFLNEAGQSKNGDGPPP